MNGFLTHPSAIGRIINRALHSRTGAVPSFGRGLVPMSVRRAIRVPTRSIVLPSLRRPRSPNGDAANTYSIPRPKIADRSRCCFFAVLTANRRTALWHNLENREVRRACSSPVFSGEPARNAAAQLDGIGGLSDGLLGERRDDDHRPAVIHKSMDECSLWYCNWRRGSFAVIFSALYAGSSRRGCTCIYGEGSTQPGSARPWPAGN
jgi:hypothetical protein